MKLVLLIIFLSTKSALFACFGEVIDLENTEWESLDEVFIGKVIKVEQKMMNIFPPFEDMLTLVGFETTFEVDKKWKGTNSNIVKIIQSGSSCSEFYYIGDFRYFITAKRRKFANNVEGDTKNKLYLTTEGTNLTIGQRTEDSLYNYAVALMDSIYASPLKLIDNRKYEKVEHVKTENNSIIVLLIGFIIGNIIMYLIVRQMKYNR